jgi:hypothetical protein
MHRLIDIVQELQTAPTRGVAYFGIAEVFSPLHEIDKGVRRRLPILFFFAVGSAVGGWLKEGRR